MAWRWAHDALRKLGLRIPEDVSVIGFDNQELIAVHLYPSLSTMALPHYAMGRWAVNYLLDAGRFTTNAVIQHVLECRYIERSSIAGMHDAQTA